MITATPKQTPVPEGVTISFLETSIYYFLSAVFLIKSDNLYRLIVIGGGKLLVDVTYKTPRGARIAFQRLYKDRRDKDVVSEDRWSHFFPPDDDWLDKQLNHVRAEEIYNDEMRNSSPIPELKEFNKR